mgnify:CR=1 FL=1
MCIRDRSITEETRIDLVQEYEAETMQKQEQAQEQSESGPLQPLVDVVPANIFDAATNNRNMLQVIFFAIFFGIGIILVDPKLAIIVGLVFCSIWPRLIYDTLTFGFLLES